MKDADRALKTDGLRHKKLKYSLYFLPVKME